MREFLRAWDPGRGVAVGLLVLLGAAPAMGQTAREAEDVFWRDVVCERELEVRAYLKTYPDGAYVSEARACLEQGLGLTRAERIRVQAGLQAAGQEPGPAAKTRRAAAEQAAQEEAPRQADDAAYAAAERTDTAAAYGEYLEAYPAGRHADAARERQAARREGEAFRVGRTFRDDLRSGGEGPEMVVVPVGAFRMGSPSYPSYEVGRDDDEGPVHRVMIGEAFAVGVHEVTRGEYERFVEATGHTAGNSCRTYEGDEWEERAGRNWRDPGYRQSGEHPVVCVSWKDAQAYVAWLRRESGAPYRLLSESEWEYVARGGTETARYWGEGEAEQCRHANGADANTEFDWKIACNDGHARPAPVGSYTENGSGLYDVMGNVWEWVEDCWNENYEGAPTDGTAWTRGNCSIRMVRGGSWLNEPSFLRSAVRGGVPTGNRYYYVGFRVARSLTP